MIGSDNRFLSFNHKMKDVFGTKMMKLSLDGGFSCPNRDGTIGSKGCIFCSEEGSGEFTGNRGDDIVKQMQDQKELLSNKWADGKYIAFFQNFTNTYSDYDDLKEKYYSAINEPEVEGLAIATRPDCLSEEVLDLLSEINEKTFLWVELGLQTIHGKTAKFIRRGYSLRIYSEAITQLRARNIRVVTHLIFGLPGESAEEMIESAKFVAATNTWGIKIHSLYIQKDTDLHRSYLKEPFDMLEMDEYVKIVVDAIEYLPKNMVIHRMTGDCKRSELVEPLWSANKRRVLSSIEAELRRRDSYQGWVYDQ